VLRSDFQEPIVAIALYSEYVQKKKDGTPNSMWQKMAANQLAKCAESLALRKAFPRDLSGFYSREEMGQAEVTATEAREEVKQRKLRAISEAKQIEAPNRSADGIEISDIEQRHSAEVAEVQAVIEETEAKPKPKRHKGDISFKALAAFKEIKKALREVSGTDQLYYDSLKAAGVDHADEMAHEPSKAVYKAMANILARLRADKTTEQEFGEHLRFLGDDKFFKVLGTSGFESIKDVIDRATSEQTTTILAELRAL
jgi:RecT family protein